MGTTRNHILFFILSAVTFSYSISMASAVVAASVVRSSANIVSIGGKGNKVAFGASGHKSATHTENNEIACEISFSALTFAGQKFTGPAVCVKAKDDDDASTACNGALFVNPANPQYGATTVENGASDKNPAGYYYCVDYSEANRKENLCENLARAASPMGLNFVYREMSSSRWGDGTCTCGTESSPTANCDEGPQAVIASLSSGQCSAPGLQPYTRPGTGSDMGPLCSCANVAGKFFAAGEAAASCAEEERLAANPAAAAQSAQAGAVAPSLEACLNTWVETSQSCKAKAEEAKSKCDETNSRNGPSNAAADITGSMGDMYSAANQASGSRAECFRAGVVANTGQQAIRSMQATCEADFRGCSDECAEGRLEAYKRDCEARAGRSFASLLQDTTPAGEAFRQKNSQIESNFTEGRQICTVQAQEKRSTLSNLLSGLGRALQSSVRCVCQTSSAGGDCGAIPPVQDCSRVPQPEGCGAYGAMNTCTPGSPGYNAKTCGCMQNPAQPGCSNASNAVSSFAGPGIANNLARGTAGGGVNFSGGPGGGRGSGFSVAGNGEIENNDLSFLGGSKNGSGAPNNSISGGGGAAGPGGPTNGNATEDKGALAGDEEKGIGGLFNSAKTFMSNALGLGKKPVAGPGNGAAGKPDMGKFKPGNLRGIAGRSSGMGSKNMDIWKMMNSCTSGDTCKSNENNYLVAP